MKIAIDGPAGAGKTTVGRALAKAFSCTFINTGRMYRAVAWGLSRHLELSEMQIEITSEERILLNGQEITKELDTPDIDEDASKAAARADVRERLVQLQREMARTRDVVMEGRDIGTVVLPDADFKIFLTASLEERARRRFRERGGGKTFEQILRQMRERDTRDSLGYGRLQITPETHVIQTDGRSLEEVIQELLKRITATLKER